MNRRGSMGNIGIATRIILKWITEKQYMKGWTWLHNPVADFCELGGKPLGNVLTSWATVVWMGQGNELWDDKNLKEMAVHYRQYLEVLSMHFPKGVRADATTVKIETGYITVMSPTFSMPYLRHWLIFSRWRLGFSPRVVFVWLVVDKVA